MNDLGTLKLRMSADFLLVCLIGFAAPPILSLLCPSCPVLFASFAALLLAVLFLYDALRILGRLRKTQSN